jgi:hypothetical protein
MHPYHRSRALYSADQISPYGTAAYEMHDEMGDLLGFESRNFGARPVAMSLL